MTLTQDPISCGELLFLIRAHCGVFPTYYLDPARAVCGELVKQSDEGALSRCRNFYGMSYPETALGLPVCKQEITHETSVSTDH